MPETGWVRFEEEHALHDLVAGLRPERREAFVITQIAGLSYADAAEICGCPVGTIRSRVARAREDLVVAMHEARAGRRGAV
jgi:RNA polymerase sigma-70 factor (ECF subfamily)